MKIKVNKQIPRSKKYKGYTFHKLPWYMVVTKWDSHFQIQNKYFHWPEMEYKYETVRETDVLELEK